MIITAVIHPESFRGSYRRYSYSNTANRSAAA